MLEIKNLFENHDLVNLTLKNSNNDADRLDGRLIIF